MATTAEVPMVEAWSLPEPSHKALGVMWHPADMRDTVQVAGMMVFQSVPMDTGISSVISTYDIITELPDVHYRLRLPIPVHLTREDDGEWTARFELANIGISDKNKEGAKDSLAYDILDMMDFLTEYEGALIPELKHSLAMLRCYIEACKP